MGTRGTFGFRKNNEDKLAYNHFDSYPDGLGADIVDFCKGKTIEQLNEICNRIILIDDSIPPTREQIKDCEQWTNLSVSNQSTNDWYCLLREAQGDLEAYTNGLKYMLNGNNFIKDSLFCEYGYIINLDTNKLEYWEGFQNEADENNRYGTEKDGEYYPCKMIMEFDLENIPENVIESMNGNNDKDDEETPLF